jgi:RND family efflux transporter MFP subunit
MTESNDTGPGEHVPNASAAAEPESWADLTAARDPKSFSRIWLKLQSGIIGADVVRGVVVMGAPDSGPFAPTAVWPEGGLGSPWLVAGIESAITRRETVVESGKRSPTNENPKRKLDVISHPLLVDNQICGAVSIEIEHRDADGVALAADQLRWGMVWLEVLVRRSKFTSADRLSTVIELIATGLDQERFQAAATAVVTELAGILHCERVSIAFLHSRHARVKALSHSAAFSRKANVIRAIEASMDEAIDQQATVIFPAEEDGPLQVTRAHAALSETHGAGSICTVPFAEGERLLGAITLERPADEPFDSRTVQLCEHAGALLGPLLDIKRKDDRLLIQKAGDSLSRYAQKLTGPRHSALKLISFGLLATLIFFSVVNGDFRVTADARLEGVVQRALAAPLAGYIAEANVRAGDIVEAGDVMFTLDDRDLWLERLKWMSQKLQYTREYNEAVAMHERAQASVLAAQVDQAEAQIALIEEQLQRVQVQAPFKGIVVSGDLSQSLGIPVERGDVLFEIAPLDAYRVILQVDERDISEIVVGQEGQLALTGLPGQKLPITVEKVTPVATAEEGQNFFRVEASLGEEASPLLRPGMEGVGKVEVDQRKLIWIWTYKIVFWIRMFFWSWWP